MKDQIKAGAAFLLVGALIYVVYTQVAGSSLLGGKADGVMPPEPDVSALSDLKKVKTVEPTGVLGEAHDYDQGGRNLFQYGPAKPPPPTPEELERMRKAEEARLKAMEEEARKRADEQKRLMEENEARAREARELAQKQNAAEIQAQAVRAAAPPPKPPAPPINYKLVGWLGPQQQRIAVFLNGKDIVLARKGEVLEGKFKLLSMGAESVEMGYVDPTYADTRKRLELSP